MTITPHGAAGGEVTGSAYLVEAAGRRVLVDCGMFQGSREADARNRAPIGGIQDGLDAVLVTHAHLDHTGRLPVLVREGYAGVIHATPATIELTGLILRDAAKIQANDIERTNRRRARDGKPALEPLYTPEHVRRTMALFRPVPYDAPVAVAPGLSARWVEAGHMLGSASIELTVREGRTARTVVFSGDLGPRGAPILRDFERFSGADILFLESTYGDRNHKPFQETVEEFTEVVNRAAASGGRILVPAFAVGRAQVVMALMAWLFRMGKVRPFPVCLDSPMAAEATEIYRSHPELWDEQIHELVRDRRILEELRSMDSRIAVTIEESRALNDLAGPCMIIAGSGMCNAGRILHHLRHHLAHPATSVIIVGFQGRGTLGRLLVDGVREVNIFGDPIRVRAGIHTLGGFSAHAGQDDLLHWFGSLAPSCSRVFLTHGEDDARMTLARRIRDRYHRNAHLPALGEKLVL